MGYIDEKGLKTALEGVKQYVDSSNRTVDWDDIRNKPFEDRRYINISWYACDFNYDDAFLVYHERVPLYIWNESTGEVTFIGPDEIVEFTCSNGEKLILQGKYERDSDGYIVWTITTIQPVYESWDNIVFGWYDIKTIDEKYIPDTIARQEDLTELSERISENEVLIEDLQNTKIDKEADDYYPKMAVGTADNLSGVEVVDSSFITRQSGGGAITDGVARMQSIKGNSLVWNQILDTSKWMQEKNGIVVTKDSDNNFVVNGTATGEDSWILCHRDRFDLIKGNKYILLGCPQGGSNDTYALFDGNGITMPDFGGGVISEAVLDYNTAIYIVVRKGVTVSDLKYKPCFVDLTKMFGAGNEPSSVEEFYARLPLGVDLYAYNEGEVVNMNVDGIKSVGVNEGEESTEDLSIVGKYFPNGMLSAGEYRDEIRYNKATQKWEKITRIGELDLGDLNWTYYDGSKYFYSNQLDSLLKNDRVISTCSKEFADMTWSPFTLNYDGARIDAIALWFNGEISRLNICCDRYNNDIVSFREYVAGKKIYYALENPIVIEIEERDFNLDYLVWNGGTEEALASKPSSALRAEITYGFNAVGKIKELEEKFNSGGGSGVSKEYVDTKVTELSTQVGGLSERVEDLEQGGQGGEQEVFWATYGTTTYDEIVAAHNEGKNVLCIYNNNIAQLSQILESVLYFFVVGANAIRVSCFKGGAWSYKTYNFSHELSTLDNGNAQITIAGKTAEVATPQYVENLLGVIINGDY